MRHPNYGNHDDICTTTNGVTEYLWGCGAYVLTYSMHVWYLYDRANNLIDMWAGYTPKRIDIEQSIQDYQLSI